MSLAWCLNTQADMQETSGYWIHDGAATIGPSQHHSNSDAHSEEGLDPKAPLHDLPTSPTLQWNAVDVALLLSVEAVETTWLHLDRHLPVLFQALDDGLAAQPPAREAPQHLRLLRFLIVQHIATRLDLQRARAAAALAAAVAGADAGVKAARKRIVELDSIRQH
eukprot:CAMPEP_0181176578 /NCGR_PEP_ID=MMETSP1096-20121128/4704_1 /TAXON_ID=156174 ORGANISM="Chrysochromulina ericina, Strain CCMP281" /NCGR_SAMPLE_ID=MMETSP1096 /ASSEMBLY_ACC=CAM_ASM_000453 /LENGTH=164 /DNA_ID=CAMNT_0023264675 /DNA_START=222 /DNA_END=716 /DNA_ORIENTATION=-